MLTEGRCGENRGNHINKMQVLMKKEKETIVYQLK